MVLIPNFDQNIQLVQRHIDLIHQWYLDSFKPSPELFAETLCHLSLAVEELHIAQEELQKQNEKLCASRQELEQQRQRYQELFQFAPDGYLVTNKWGTIQEANLIASEMLNRRPAHLVGKPLSLFMPLLERRPFYNLLQRLWQEERIKGAEIVLQPRNSSPLTAAISIAPIRDEQNQLIGFRWLLRDLTQLRAAQAENQRQQERTRLLAEVRLKIRQSGQLEKIWQTAVSESQKLLKVEETIIVRLESDHSGTVVAQASSAGKLCLLGQNWAGDFWLAEFKGQDSCGISQIRPEYYFPSTLALNQLTEISPQLELTNLVAPIFVRQKLWGFLAFHRCAAVHQWEFFEMDTGQQLADQIGIAITQAEFIGKMEELIDQQTKVISEKKDTTFKKVKLMLGNWIYR